MSGFRSMLCGAALGLGAALGIVTLQYVLMRIEQVPVAKEAPRKSLQQGYEDRQAAAPFYVPDSSAPLVPGIEPLAIPGEPTIERKHRIHAHAHTIEFGANNSPIVE